MSAKITVSFYPVFIDQPNLNILDDNYLTATLTGVKRSSSIKTQFRPPRFDRPCLSESIFGT